MAKPVYHFGNHMSFAPCGTPIRAPRCTQALDCELELGAVQCKPLLDATPAEALGAIGGFVVVNDWSARDIQHLEGHVEVNGDVVATGTLPFGSSMDNGRWLQPGDALRLVIEGVGEINHTVKA